MRKIKEVLRLKFDNGLSANKIAKVCNIGRATVQEYLRRFNVSGLPWPLPPDMSDEELDGKLFPVKKIKYSQKPPIDFEYMVQEIRKHDVNLEVLWSEYKQANHDGYGYSHFCELFNRFRKKLNYSMRQEHKAGEKGFIDFGKGLDIVDPLTGEVTSTRLFVFVWGASNYTFARAVRSEDLASWIKVNTESFEFFGCCPKTCVPDNLKSAVTKACRYEPDINPTYAEFAAHYDTAIIPARPYKPKDKAKVETGVKLGKRWILARLRNRIFTNIHQLNEAIMELLDQFNDKPLKKINKSRRELFELLDKPNALPLPDVRYEFAEWKTVTVNINYHVNFDDHDYSVPYTLIHQRLEVRATFDTVEIYKGSMRIYAYRRSYQKYKYTTIPEHMPPSHQKYIEWSPERILNWAGKYGSEVKILVQEVMKQRKHPQQAFKSCLGIIRLGNHYSAERLNNACKRAMDFRIYTYKGVKNILIKNLDGKEEYKKQDDEKIIKHNNIRGAEYYSENLELFNNI